MQHRFAHVAANVQDLHGVDPARIGRVTTPSDAWFTGSSAAAILQRLEATPDGVPVSQETDNDFQLSRGGRDAVEFLRDLRPMANRNPSVRAEGGSSVMWMTSGRSVSPRGFQPGARVDYR